MLFENAWLSGDRVDLRVKDGHISALRVVSPAGGRPAAPPLVALQGETVIRDGILLPHMAEPHVHLDATQLGARLPNRSGTLREGIANWATLREGLTWADVRQRALTTLRWYVSHGVTRVRTHVDTACLPAVEALLALRAEVAEGLPGLSARGEGGLEQPVPVQLQVVAFPQEGILRGPGRRDRWEQVLAMGVDAAGAIPHFERTMEEGWRSVRLCFEAAERHGIAVDIHCDETDDPISRNLEVVCAETLDRGMGGRVVAGHCTALHSYENPHAAKVIELVAQSGVLVVCNPLDNVVLQGRYDSYPRRRGITRVDQLWAAGAPVGVGHDSVVDPWYRLGTASLLDPAWMLLHLGHLTGEAEMLRLVSALTGDNHRPFGEAPRLSKGAPADLLWYPAEDPIELLRLRPRPRVFVGGGEVVVPIDEGDTAR